MLIVGQTPIGYRQKSAAQFAGEKPIDTSSILYEPFIVEQVALYVDPDDHTQSALHQGGLFDFGGSHAVRILEIRGLAALGNISAIVGDRSDTKNGTLAVGGATPAIDLVALGVIPGDIVTVVSAGPVTEIYTVKEVISTTALTTEEIISPQALVVGDIFTITDAKGTTTRYTHTLAGVDTLDITLGTTYDVPVGTPITSRLIFIAPLIVLPSQVLKVSTVSSNAAGWIDVYVVKAEYL